MSRRTVLSDLKAFNDRLARIAEDVESGETTRLRSDLLLLSELFDEFVIAYEEGEL